MLKSMGSELVLTPLLVFAISSVSTADFVEKVDWVGFIFI